MIKALLKKQFLETVSFFFFSAREGKKRKPAAIVAFAVLMLYALASVVAMFYMIAETLCAPLVTSGLDWVYFAFAGITAFGIGAIGSAFAAKSKLFEAKDNDLLLSMPLPAWAVLFTRMLSLYLLTLLLTSLAWIPSVVQYFIVVGVQPLPLLFSAFLTLVLPLGTLAVCALLGWLIAVVTARLRNKNLLTVLFFAAFMTLYFLLVGKMNDYLEYIVVHGEAVGKALRAVYPFYLLGLAATGKPLAFLGACTVFIATLALAYLLLDKTFFKLVTANRGERKRKYKSKTAKTKGAFFALFHRECLRFFTNPMIFLNCALGSVLLLLLPVLALFNLDFCRQLASANADSIFALLLCAIVSGVATTNTVTASSVSLEGESLWVVRCMPVPTWTVLTAKLALHILVSGLPALIAVCVLAPLIGLSLGWFVLVACAVLVFTCICAEAGLCFNLKLPNLHWTNEIAAVKQSVSVLLTMFAGIAAVALPVVGYIAFGKYLPELAYLCICLALFVGVGIGLGVWLKKRGVRLFENL